jgi:hypothetical protein
VPETWKPDAPGIMRLPSGRLIRGRAFGKPLPAGELPDFAVYLLGKRPPAVEWESTWVRWPDFWLPIDRHGAREALRMAWGRAESERVEIACMGGLGRTGTALACIAVLDGVPSGQAVAFVRQHYKPHAVEVPWQRLYVSRFARHY